MGMRINKVYDANIFVNNETTHGLASEVTCPVVTAIMNEYNALGMFGTARYFNGIEPMEASIKWTYPSNELLTAFADATQVVNCTIFSSKAEYDNRGLSDEIPIEIKISGYPIVHQGGTFAPKTDVEVESQIAVNAYKLVVDGQDIIEVNVEANIYMIDGVDVMAKRRANLGL